MRVSDDDVIVESEPGDTSCESESDAIISLYTPTLVRENAHPIDFPKNWALLPCRNWEIY